MRQDMFKIICERPRLGVGYYRNLPNSYRKAKRVKLDDDLECVDQFSGVNKLPMYCKQQDGWDRKRFNDYLSPLWRFIDKQVGRPWDDVYSEICNNINLDSTTRRHVREHVDRHVELNIVFNEDGDPCTKASRWGNGYTPLYKGELYKDPNDGLLKKFAGVKKPEKEVAFRTERFFDKNGKEFTPVYGWRRPGDYNPDGLTFKFETTGEQHKKYDGTTKSWFKYYYIEVDRVRIRFVKDENGEDVRLIERYKDKVRVRDTASKAEIKKYCLND